MEAGSRFNLYLACLIANLASLSNGMCITWTSPTLSRLSVSENEAAWLGSLLPLGALLGPLLAGGLSDRLGRRPTLTLAALLMAASWALLLPGRPLALLYVARVVGGVAMGVNLAVVPMYIAEISDDKIRGQMGSLLGIFMCFGFSIEYIVGPFVFYTTLVIVSLLFPLLFLAVFPFFMPETPYFYVLKGRDEDAVKSLRWLRKGAFESDLKEELFCIKTSVASSQGQRASLSTLLLSPATRLACGAIASLQMSGISVVLFFSESIFNMTGSSMSSYVCLIILSVVLSVSSLCVGPMLSRFGMKTLMCASSLSAALFQALLGVSFLLHDKGSEYLPFSWLPIVFLIGYVIAYSFGLGPLPWAIVGEVFPLPLRPMGTALSAMVCNLLSFLTARYFFAISSALGTYVTFWIFSFCCLLTFVFSLFLVPDTRGKSFDDIQEMFNKR